MTGRRLRVPRPSTIGRPAGERRWDLTDDERARLVELRTERLRPLVALQLVLRSPRIMAEALVSVKRALRNSLFQDSAFVWVIDSERIRRGVAPDAARGVAFADEKPFLDVLLPMLKLEQAALELGGGDGRIARHVAPRVGRLICTDPSPLMTHEARENLRVFRNVDVVRTKGVTLQEFADHSFDIVFAQGVFSYLDPNESLALLDSAHRILRPGGRLVANFFTIDDPEWLNMLLVALRRAAASNRLSAGLFRPYTSTYACELVRAAGFHMVTGAYPRGGIQREPFLVSARN